MEGSPFWPACEITVSPSIGTDSRRDKPHRLWRFVVMLVLIIFAETRSMADDDLLRLPLTGWRLVTDGVMGGVSRGTLSETTQDGRRCLHLEGQVSTANNGGFIQAAQEIAPADAKRLGAYAGVRVALRGNGEAYNIHLRTSDLWLPWQSFRATVQATGEWRTVSVPFADFTAYKTRAQLRPERLRRLGIVAIGRDFAADLCIGEVAFYARAVK